VRHEKQAYLKFHDFRSSELPARQETLGSIAGIGKAHLQN
jgi:hypothetical protein